MIQDITKSYGDSDTENMLIHGNNLLALKALEIKFSGIIKCIYIDPPYNTGAAFEFYDDNLEHSIWLSIMKRRLELLRGLLSEDGTIWIQIDDEEQAYLKILCDEIFGRSNFVNMISVNMKNVAGASGGGEDKRLKKNCEYILVYVNDIEKSRASLVKMLAYRSKYLQFFEYEKNSDDKMAASHAKILTIDSDKSLVSSANLSYHGLSGNIEMGFLVRSADKAKQIEELLKELVRMHVYKKIS